MGLEQLKSLKELLELFIGSSTTNKRNLYYTKYFYQYCAQLKQKFVNQRFKQKLTSRHIKSFGKRENKKLLIEREYNTSENSNIRLVMTCSPFLQIFSNAVHKYLIVFYKNYTIFKKVSCFGAYTIYLMDGVYLI